MSLQNIPPREGTGHRGQPKDCDHAAVGSSCILAWMPLPFCGCPGGRCVPCQCGQRNGSSTLTRTHLDKLGQLLLELFEARLLDLVLFDELGLDRAEFFPLLLEAVIPDRVRPGNCQRALAPSLARRGPSFREQCCLSSPFPLRELKGQAREHEPMCSLVRLAFRQRNLETGRGVFGRRELPQLVEIV